MEQGCSQAPVKEDASRAPADHLRRPAHRRSSRRRSRLIVTFLFLPSVLLVRGALRFLDPNQPWAQALADSELDPAARQLRARLDRVRQETRDAADQLAAVGSKYLADHDYVSAEPVLLEALHLQEDLSAGSDDPQTAQTQFELSQVYYGAHRLDLAMRYGQRALESRQRLFGGDSPVVLVSLEHLSLVCNEAGDYDAARPLAEQALRLRQNLHPAGSIEIANAQANLAMILMNQSQLEPAREHFNAALDIFQSHAGPDDPNVAMVLNNLATIDLRQKNFDDARELAQRAVQIREQRNEDADLAIALNTLAQICEAQGDFAAAQNLYTRAASIDARALGEDNPCTLAMKLNAAMTCKNLGQFDQAIEQLQPIVQSFEKIGMEPESRQARSELQEAMVQRQFVSQTAVQP